MYCESIFARGRSRLSALFAVFLVLPFASGTALAQDDESDDEEQIEEIVTVGSQIKGADIRDALAVSVVTAAEIEELGVDSGDDLLEFMAEQGQNFFSNADTFAGSVNSARGDVGAYNLRNLGTGNTLVLLNGRRMVNMATYQTELSGGSFVPVNSVNSQSLPVFGIERVEVLRDGASAIYGADAVAGVVNYVMKSDFDGLTLQARYVDYEGLTRNDAKFTFEWGRNFNDGRTNLSIFGSYYDRKPVKAADDKKWRDSDFRRLIPENSPFAGDTSFRRDSINSLFGQYDVRTSVSGFSDPNNFFDGSGEFNTYPLDSENCDFFDPQYPNVCFVADGNNITRYNMNEERWILSEAKRTNVFAFLTHEFGNGMESFTEVSAYISDTLQQREQAAKLSAVAKYRIAADAYWNPLGAVGTSARLPDSIIGPDIPVEGLELEIDNYRSTENPRRVYNDGETYRFLTGLRGQAGDWDWEGAVSWSRAEKEDITKDRISNTLLQEALNDPTPAGYNVFAGGVDSNVERIYVDVFRKNATELTTADFKMSNAELFDIWAGPVGFLAGIEWREEYFEDDRDPRLDGTIEFVDSSGDGFPIVSDVLGSSPTADSEGDREVFSAFVEFQVPLHERLDAQFAVRYEDFSDVGETTVGKVAMGWRPWDPFLIRGSWSEAYRVPNLVTVNESGVARSNFVDDRVCEYVSSFDVNEIVDWSCNYGVQRAAGGSKDLVAEESDNTSLGVVWDITDSLTVTVDWWSIEKDKTIGLFGEENHTALELLGLIQAGTGSCPTTGGPSIGNERVIREDPYDPASDEASFFALAGICNTGEAVRVNDTYANLDTRKIRGHDIGVYYEKDTGIGDFNFRYLGSKLDEYEQLASGPALALIQAKEDGVLPPGVEVVGFANLVRVNGNQRWKHTARLSWRKGDWGASVSGTKLTDAIETRPGLGSDDSPWIVKPMSTYNMSVDYRFDTFADSRARARFGIINFTDARAPLASKWFGYFSDMHRDYGRAFYLDLRLDF
ncbi:MAG: TonB-dependent receptor [Woeseiaceae bacterium]